MLFGLLALPCANTDKTDKALIEMGHHMMHINGYAKNIFKLTTHKCFIKEVFD